MTTPLTTLLTLDSSVHALLSQLLTKRPAAEDDHGHHGEEMVEWWKTRACQSFIASGTTSTILTKRAKRAKRLTTEHVEATNRLNMDASDLNDVVDSVHNVEERMDECSVTPELPRRKMSSPYNDHDDHNVDCNVDDDELHGEDAIVEEVIHPTVITDAMDRPMCTVCGFEQSYYSSTAAVRVLTFLGEGSHC